MDSIFQAFQISDAFDRVVSIDFDSLELLANGAGVTGTISITTDDGRTRDFTGEHSFDDFADEFGFIIEIDEV